MTGLYYYGQRYLDPFMSVFLGVDPMMDKHSNFSPFAYCYNNPINLIDPFGLDTVPAGDVSFSTFNLQNDVIDFGSNSKNNYVEYSSENKLSKNKSIGFPQKPWNSKNHSSNVIQIMNFMRYHNSKGTKYFKLTDAFSSYIPIESGGVGAYPTKKANIKINGDEVTLKYGVAHGAAIGDYIKLRKENGDLYTRLNYNLPKDINGDYYSILYLGNADQIQIGIPNDSPAYRDVIDYIWGD